MNAYATGNRYQEATIHSAVRDMTREDFSQRVRTTKIRKRTGQKGWALAWEEKEFSRQRTQRPYTKALGWEET